jgi:hypothetical protein
MKTFQQIYDFCLLDRTYNEYFNIPDSFACKTKREYLYYHGSVHPRGISKAGTFIYGQSMKQLERFLGKQRKDRHIHIDPCTFEIENDSDFFEGRIYIIAHIKQNGVQIEFNDPFKYKYYLGDDRIRFTARSHRPFNTQGLIDEVKEYIEKKLRFAPGRYRDLQVKYEIPKEKFIAWYKNYKEDLEAEAKVEWLKMHEKYHPTERMDFEESYGLLQTFGIFSEFGCDSDIERERLAEEFMDLCNR